MRLRVVLICLLAVSTVSAQPQDAGRPLTEDSGLVVALDSVTRSDSISTTVTRRGKRVPVTSSPTSKDHDCVSVKLTLVSTKEGHVVVPWGDPRSSWTHVLIDTQGKEWRQHQLQVSRPEGQDPAEARKGIIPDGGEIHIWFFVSKTATPKTLKLAYAYSGSQSGDEPNQQREIAIDLRKPPERQTSPSVADTGR